MFFFLPITGFLMKEARETSRQTNALINIFVSETWGKPIMATVNPFFLLTHEIVC